jgi:hypothetical protein
MPLFELGPSGTTAGRVALVLGLVLLAAALAERRWGRCSFEVRARVLIPAYAALAAALSGLYVVYFLKGGPRIIDATAYFLQARALAEGHLAFPIPAPTAAFRGRFALLGPHGLAGIFPPGYPLLLAAGFRLHAPMLIGPVLAALLVVATYRATKELVGREDAARTAALLSALCAALRYHTADTMSHGLSALLLVTALMLAARPSLIRGTLAGLLAGWLLATRPMTGAVAATLALSLVVARSSRRERWLNLGAAALWLIPGLVLLAAQQRAATGSFFASTQLSYYALADGPPGCFRWGFGPNVGCRFEHGDFVKRHLVGGFGPLAALRTTGERLLWHLFDVANLAPAALLLPWIVWRERANSGVRWAAAAVAGVFAAYLPFYYPGSYPGGGARFFADALPLEHALLGLSLVSLGLERFAPAGLVLGFALNTVHSHLALAAREGGRPMFDPRAVRELRNGLVFVATDHGFDLGHDPKRRDPRREVVVARGHGDAHDLALWQRFGRPPSYVYDYSPETGRSALRPFVPASVPLRWEAEAEWPPLAVHAGWAHPDFRPCLSRGAGLHLRPAPVATVELELGAPDDAVYEIKLGWLADPGTVLSVTLGRRKLTLVHGPGTCESASLGAETLGAARRVTLETRGDVVVDGFELTRVNAKYR